MTQTSVERSTPLTQILSEVLATKHFSGRRAPGVSGVRGVRVLTGSFRKPLAYLEESVANYGAISRLELRLGRIHWVSHLIASPAGADRVLKSNQENYRKAFTYAPLKALLGDGLLTSEGTTWLTHRRLMQPSFHKQSVAQAVPTIVESVREFSTRLDERSMETFSLGSLMSRLTLDIVGRVLFGKALGERAGAVHAAVTELQKLALKAFSSPVVWPFVSEPRRVPIQRYRQALATLDEVIEELVASARREGKEASILARIGRATGEHGPFTESLLRDEAMTLVLAGHETTANALTWAFCLLEQNPSTKRRLHEEVDHALDGQHLEPDALESLPYTRAVFEEALRLYPPAWTIDRDAIEDDEVDGFAIPARSTVFVSPYLIHRNSEVWPEPHRFDPERFLRARPSPFSYIPFGAGRRQCIGAHFATTEGVIALAMLSQQFEFQLLTRHVMPIAEVTLRPDRPLLVRVSPRQGPSKRQQ